MTTHQINNRLQDILTNLGINLTALTDQANFARDLGLDSLDVTDLLMQTETGFGIRIPDEDYARLTSMQGVLTYLEEEQAIA